jgi:hypothetical protein
MRQLTPEQKIEAYTYAMIKLWAFDRDYAVCIELYDWMRVHFPTGILRVDEVIQLHFPEFLKQRPKIYGMHWWPTHNRAPRLRALEKAIALVQKH